MAVGNYNHEEYMKKLYEASEEGGVTGDSKEGLIIPAENKKAYDWLKKEYNTAQTEVKVEMKMGGVKFEPGYDMQSPTDSVKEFKPGMFGDAKTSDSEGTKKSEPKSDDGGLSSGGDAKKSEKKEEKSDDKKGVKVKGAGVGKKEKNKKEEKEEDAD